MRIKFEGAEADGHRLEAYEGIKSIEGLIRVARIATHYAATAEVRFRAPYTDLLEIQISQIINGSFEMLFDYASKISDHIQSMNARSKAEAVFQHLLARGTGQTEEDDVYVNGTSLPSGDVAAMAEAAESGLKAAHRWIDTTGKQISIIDGDETVGLDLGTKEYVETEILGDEAVRDVSVAALNANSKNGRIYFLDEHRTVPFIVHRDAAAHTVANLSTFLSKYVNKTGETVNIRFRPVQYMDGRLKRLIIFDCYLVGGAA